MTHETRTQTALQLTGNSSRKNPCKVWGKVLSGVDPTLQNGFAFHGEWLPKTDNTVVASLAAGAVVVLTSERGTRTYWLCLVGGDAQISEKGCDWNGSVQGTGTLLCRSSDISEILSAAIAAGVPITNVELPPRAETGRSRCLYTGKRWSGEGLCPHCGDEC